MKRCQCEIGARVQKNNEQAWDNRKGRVGTIKGIPYAEGTLTLVPVHWDGNPESKIEPVAISRLKLIEPCNSTPA